MTKQSSNTIKQPAVYILANKRNGTIYTGVTSNLIKRVYEHKSNVIEGFTKRYQCHNLVYYEMYENLAEAICREKQIKAGSRKNKLNLIEGGNPLWSDLYEQICA